MVQTGPMRAALVVLVWLTAAPALAAERLEPDRPELTESAKLVPRGSFQLETGVALSKERGAGEPTERTLELEAARWSGTGRTTSSAPG
jgi:hypothetical protein